MTTKQDATLAALRREVQAAGIVRTRAMTAAGFSPHYQALAVRSGRLCRVGRSWLAASDDDPRVRAARAGAVLTCLSEARRRGLWRIDDGMLHLGLPPHGRGVPGGHRLHWSVPPVPRHPDAVVDPIENVLALVAECRPHDEALAVWESAVRQGLVAIETMRRLPLRPAARALCAEATPWSDSGLESFVPPRLRWMRLPIVPQVWIAGHRVDFLIGARLALQIDGGHHVGAQREQDIAHDALLMTMGYHVIRVGYAQVVDRWPAVQDLVMRAVAQGLHLAR